MSKRLKQTKERRIEFTFPVFRFFALLVAAPAAPRGNDAEPST